MLKRGLMSMYFYQKLQNIRKEKRITQEELADKLNVSRQAVSKWESGQTMPEIEKIIQIAKMYDVSLDYLLKDEDENVEINNQISNLPLNSETQPSKKEIMFLS